MSFVIEFHDKLKEIERGINTFLESGGENSPPLRWIDLLSLESELHISVLKIKGENTIVETTIPGRWTEQIELFQTATSLVLTDCVSKHHDGFVRLFCDVNDKYPEGMNECREREQLAIKKGLHQLLFQISLLKKCSKPEFFQHIKGDTHRNMFH